MCRSKAQHGVIAAVLGTVLSIQSLAIAEEPPAADATSPADAEAKKKEAITRYNRGLELYEEQDYNAALIEFRKAYELSPNYRIRYNIGQVCYQLQDYACALKSLESYLFEGGTNLPASRRLDVEKDIDKLRSRVGKLEVRVNIEGAQISVDDVVVGKSPLPGPIQVSAGKRRISVTHEGRVPSTRTIEVAGATMQSVEIELVENTGQVKLVERPSKFTTLSWIGIGTAVALGAGAGVFGAMTLGAQKELEDTRFVGGAPDRETEDRQNRVKTLALTTDILAGAAVLTLGTTLVLTLIRDPQPTGVEKDKAKASGPTVSFGVSPFGAVLGGSF